MLLFYGTIYHEKCGCRHSLLQLSRLIQLFFLCHLLNSTLVLKPTSSITLILLSLFHLLDSSSGVRPGSGSFAPFVFTELVQCLGVSLPTYLEMTFAGTLNLLIHVVYHCHSNF